MSTSRYFPALRYSLALLAAAPIVFAAGCGATTSSGALPTAAQLQPLLLASADLPAGWSADPDVNRSDDDATAQGDTPACTTALRALSSYRAAVEVKSSFVQGDGMVNAATTVDADTAARQRTQFDQHLSTLAQCPVMMPTSGAKVTFTARKGAPAVGDQSVRYNVAVAAGSISIPGFTYLSRSGGTVWMFSYLGSDDASAEQVFTTALAKWKGAAG